MKTIVVLVLILGCHAVPAAPTSTSPDVHVYENPDNSSITEGDTTLATDAETAYRVTADYARWSSMFPDIQRVVVTKQQGADARVTFVHPDGNRDNVHFHNQPAARMVWFEDTGGRAEVWAEIVFLPGDRSGTTRVHSRLFVDVHGVASIFVSDSKVRTLRQHRVHDDLVHLRRYFAGDVAVR